jgi:hypothetical protein
VVKLLANNNHSSKGQHLDIKFSTLRDYYQRVSEAEGAANIKLKQGSWCSGLMLSDAYLETKENGTHVYSHGALAEPFSNWKSFSSHYNLAKQNYLKVLAVVQREQLNDRALNDLLDTIERKMNLAWTSCFYGWFPPVYRLIPAFELLKDVHESLTRVKAYVQSDDHDTAVHWNEDALQALNSRLVQLRLGGRGGRDHCIAQVEAIIDQARQIFLLHKTDSYANAYQLLIDAAKQLDDIFEDVDRKGELFGEPNDPWDLWRRPLVNEEYV